MKNSSKQKAALVLIFNLFFCALAGAQNLDLIGVTLLRAAAANVDGSGIRVAQPEAFDNGTTNWEVNPANGSVQQPASLFTYTSSGGSSSNFPNALNLDSGHADSVAGNFYGLPGGVATNVAHVDNYEANYFINSLVQPLVAIHDLVVNQSFIGSSSDQSVYDRIYDNYAAQYNTLFVSGIGNGGPVNPPATCYNGLGVAAYGGLSSYGPTPDNGRAKPDITAPAGATSFSTPQVSGAAAVLLQAGLRGDGGSGTNSAADIRTIKALLLNGAIKPADWTNNSPSPLDTRYGAGVLNIFNSYKQLAGGAHGYIVSTSVTTNNPHPPTGDPGTVSALSGWDFNTNSSSALDDGVNHYYFNVTNNLNGAQFTATATLVWNRQQNHTNINNLDLFLYAAASSNLVACSTSLVDNVEHIFLPQLAPGRYDLQVLKRGGSFVTATETYALAWEFFSQTLNAEKIGTNVALSFPIYPAGFFVESTTNLLPPIIWNTNNLPPPIYTNNENFILLNATNPAQFFRLRRPNF